MSNCKLSNNVHREFIATTLYGILIIKSCQIIKIGHLQFTNFNIATCLCQKQFIHQQKIDEVPASSLCTVLLDWAEERKENKEINGLKHSFEIGCPECRFVVLLYDSWLQRSRIIVT